jgi:hypothetical protein
MFLILYFINMNIFAWWVLVSLSNYGILKINLDGFLDIFKLWDYGILK